MSVAIGEQRLARASGPARPRRTGRSPRPLDDATTEVVHVIGFVLRAGAGVQPVIFLDRRLLD